MGEIELTHEEMRLAERLLQARKDKGVSQDVVARALDIPRASVSAIETGKRRVSSIELKRMARLYRVPVSELLEENADDDGTPLTAQERQARAQTLFRQLDTLTDEDRKFVEKTVRILHRGHQLDDAIEDAVADQSDVGD